MDDPNRLALDLVDEAIDFGDELRVSIRHLVDDAAVVDFGIDRPGGYEAGVLLAEIATGGLATVQTGLADVGGAVLPRVELSTDHPALVLLGCQTANWTVEAAGSPTRVRGPAQLLREGGRGPVEGDFAVLAVEADDYPDEALVEAVAAAVGVPPSSVFVAVAPAASAAGRIAGAARVAAAAVSRLVASGYDAADVRSAAGVAPVPPAADAAGGARALAAAAIAYGGRAHLVVETPVEEPGRLVYGGSDEAPPERVGGDRLADVLAPAQVTLDVVGGGTQVAGGVDDARLAEQLGV